MLSLQWMTNPKVEMQLRYKVGCNQVCLYVRTRACSSNSSTQVHMYSQMLERSKWRLRRTRGKRDSMSKRSFWFWHGVGYHSYWSPLGASPGIDRFFSVRQWRSQCHLNCSYSRLRAERISVRVSTGVPTGKWLLQRQGIMGHGKWEKISIVSSWKMARKRAKSSESGSESHDYSWVHRTLCHVYYLLSNHGIMIAIIMVQDLF